MSIRNVHRGPALAVVAAMMLSLSLAACGSSSDDDSSAAGSTSTTATASGDAFVATAKQKVADYTKEQTPRTFPAGPKPKANAHVFIIPCSQALEGCVIAAKGSAAAAKALGWKTTMLDGKTSPEATNAAVEQAVNQHADGIIMITVSAQMAQQGLAKAKAAGIPVVTTTSGNTTGKDGIGAEEGSPEANFLDGEVAGYYAVADSNGKAKALVFNDPSFTTAPPIADGFVSVLEKCKDCKVEEKIDFTGATVATKLQGQATTALAKHPDVDYVFAPYGAAGTFISNAIRQSGRNVKLISTASNASNLDQIRKGDVQVASADKPLAYSGWVAMNDLIRLMGGEKPVPFQEEVKLIEKSNLPPAGKGWDTDVDYQPTFEELWGVSK